MNESVSIIIPVYNTERFLKCCLDSVMRQTYPHLEILLIDDGSTDESGQICEEYASADPRIHVIHQKNGGLSDARNKGIALATGDYLAFVDSDDYIHERYIELLLEACTKEGCDAGIANYQKVTSDTCRCAVPDLIPQEILTNVQANMRIYDYPYYIRTSTAWGKLFRRNLFHKIRFPKGRIHEDEATTYQLLYAANQVVYIDAAIYYYRQNPNGIMLSGYSERNLQYFDAIRERLTFYQQHKEKELYDLTLNRAFFDTIIHYNKTRLYLRDSETLQRKLRAGQRKLYWRLLCTNTFSIRRKLRYTWALLCPVQYYRQEVRNSQIKQNS